MGEEWVVWERWWVEWGGGGVGGGRGGWGSWVGGARGGLFDLLFSHAEEGEGGSLFGGCGFWGGGGGVGGERVGGLGLTKGEVCAPLEVWWLVFARMGALSGRGGVWVGGVWGGTTVGGMLWVWRPPYFGDCLCGGVSMGDCGGGGGGVGGGGGMTGGVRW